MRPSSIFAGIAQAEGLAALRNRGDVRVAAIDWRRDYHGEGEHAQAIALQTYPFSYRRDAAMFGTRELMALGNNETRWGANADVFTSAVYRHPEYRDAIVGHDPRSVFEDGRERA